MVRDYSNLFGAPPSPLQKSKIDTLGWQNFFAVQVDVDALTTTPPARVIEVNRSKVHVVGNDIDTMIPKMDDVAVGDWVLLNHDLPGNSEILDRKSLMKRRAAGHGRDMQLIAANVDTAFIVTSCNDDFNVARLERYIALAFEADIAPVILLTKADLVANVSEYVDQAAKISDRVPVLTLNAKSDEPITKLAPWCAPGQTVAFFGSSGVGKSTLTNALAGSDVTETQDIRSDDAKGRHTTTRRQLYALPSGMLVLDTPGMRELQLAEASSGLGELFADIDALALTCKFNDCGHVSEPGCAVTAAIAAGDLDAARLDRWRKLVAEEEFNTASMVDRRNKDKAFGKMVRTTVKGHHKRR